MKTLAPYASGINRELVLQKLVFWWPVLAGMAILYGPTFFKLVTGLWSTEGYGHGPIILALAIWLIARQWPAMREAGDERNGRKTGWAILVSALLLYVVGRSQDILIFELGSFILVLASLILIHYGSAALRAQWFPFFFLLFMVPLPSDIVGIVTVPMKLAVSFVTEQILFFIGYPIARSGVILQIGQYQLMVADACAGLQTFLTLEALGLFYLNAVSHTSRFRNIVIAGLIIPISFTANVIRVMTLTLITYHFGDEAGQGFLHGFAGMVLFITALLLIILSDKLLQAFIYSRNKKQK